MQNCPNCEKSKALVQEWLDQQGHDRCWYYPEIFKKLASVLNLKMKVEPKLPPRTEFEAGCKKYQDEEFKSN